MSCNVPDKMHGYIRGWIKTNETGKHNFYIDDNPLLETLNESNSKQAAAHCNSLKQKWPANRQLD